MRFHLSHEKLQFSSFFQRFRRLTTDLRLSVSYGHLFALSAKLRYWRRHLSICIYVNKNVCVSILCPFGLFNSQPYETFHSTFSGLKQMSREGQRDHRIWWRELRGISPRPWLTAIFLKFEEFTTTLRLSTFYWHLFPSRVSMWGCRLGIQSVRE
jgi:hypothetical protein